MRTEDFAYPLPDSVIAQYPSRERTKARLLVYGEGADMEVTHFSDLPNVLQSRFPDGTLLVRNHTAVLPCRLVFPLPHRPHISSEIFITSLPGDPFWEQIRVPLTQIKARCMIRNFKQWRPFMTLSLELVSTIGTISPFALQVEIVEHQERSFMAIFSWQEAQPFQYILQHYGRLPLPPYMRRPTDTEDKTRYQTVYAKMEGSVAAPTAGLHFSEALLHQLERQKMRTVELCLHISTDTFQPIRTEYIADHSMHGEFFSVEREVVEKLRVASHITAVGTTVLRTLESLYWLGCKACADPTAPLHTLHQQTPYVLRAYPFVQAMDAILSHMDTTQASTFEARTFLFIMPPHYTIRTAQALITNFHLPRSTLLLLIAAFVGIGQWRGIYEKALQEGFRFLSYGDASLLIRTKG